MKMQNLYSFKKLEKQISQLIEEYLKDKKERNINCGKFRKKTSDCECDKEELTSILDCICGAKNSKENIEKEKFNRHSHQYRLLCKTIVNANALFESKRKELNKCKDFNEFHDLIVSLIKEYKEATQKPILNFGPLAKYDFSLRYCKNLNIEPEWVYFHAGTLTGAKALIQLGLLDKKALNVDKNNTLRIPLEKFWDLTPLTCFTKLKAKQIEDFLCIYKSQIKNLNNT